MKKISIEKGISLLEQFSYNLDKIAKCIRINKKSHKLYLVIERDWLGASSRELLTASGDWLNQTNTSGIMIEGVQPPVSEKTPTSFKAKRLSSLADR